VADHSAIQAIDGLAERYRALGKRLHLRHLSRDCGALLVRAKDIIELNLP
jgi:SulP family sulfate permease